MDKRKGKSFSCDRRLELCKYYIHLRLTDTESLSAAFSSFPEERHLSSVINADASADKDAHASLNMMHSDTMQYGIIFGSVMIMLR